MRRILKKNRKEEKYNEEYKYIKNGDTNGIFIETRKKRNQKQIEKPDVEIQKRKINIGWRQRIEDALYVKESKMQKILEKNKASE